MFLSGAFLFHFLFTDYNYFCQHVNSHFMKKTLLYIFIIIFTNVSSQTKKYFSNSGEMIFSFATLRINGNEVGSNLRWSPFFNYQIIRNTDINNHVGFFRGIALRNVGFIYDIPGTDSLKKHRTYNLGIPLGIKIGNLNSLFIWGGYEFEIPFVYKEKTFVGEKKTDKFEIWFSNRHNWYTQSLFLGINFPRGFNIKFKYYLDNFFNKDYSETVNGISIKPFANFDAHVFYIAIDYEVFKDVREKSRKSKKSRPLNETKYTLNTKN